VYGSIEEDSQNARRTSLLTRYVLQVQDFVFHDNCGGLKDIEDKQIRIIW